MARGLFIGMVTLDLIYLSDRPPYADEKRMAEDLVVAAGGPACNAAATFSHLDNEAKLAGALGLHPLTGLIRADLDDCGVDILDLTPEVLEQPPVSSVIITKATGDRSVISRSALPPTALSHEAVGRALLEADVVLLDGHQMAVAQDVVEHAPHGPVVIDAGTWKPGFDEVLRGADCVICSEYFFPPGCHGDDTVLDYMREIGVKHAAVTHGSGPIRYWSREREGEVPVPEVQVVDTLAAGDIFHGAFCHYILTEGFVTSLVQAAEVAAFSCRFLGTRQWMKEKREESTG